jgi:hypothetical protein
MEALLFNTAIVLTEIRWKIKSLKHLAKIIENRTTNSYKVTEPG